MTTAQVLDRLLELLPPGAKRFYDTTSSSFIGKLWNGIAQVVKRYNFDRLDTLKTEIAPAKATQKIPDWEAAFDLGATKITLFGNTAARRNQVVARLRESGGFTLPNVKAILGAQLGYANPTVLEILEVSRSALSTLLAIESLGNVAIGGGGSGSKTFAVLDLPVVSPMGAQVQLTLTAGNVAQMRVVLSNPGAGYTRTWAAGYLGTGAVAGQVYQLRDPDFAGAAINGTWTLTVTDTGVGGATLGDSALLVEGIGRDIPTLQNGKGAAIFEWSARVDPLLVGATGEADYAEARRTIARMQHAHVNGYLVSKMSAAAAYSAVAIYDDPLAIEDACVYA